MGRISKDMIRNVIGKGEYNGNITGKTPRWAQPCRKRSNEQEGNHILYPTGRAKQKSTTAYTPHYYDYYCLCAHQGHSTSDKFTSPLLTVD